MIYDDNVPFIQKKPRTYGRTNLAKDTDNSLKIQRIIYDETLWA